MADSGASTRAHHRQQATPFLLNRSGGTIFVVAFAALFIGALVLGVGLGQKRLEGPSPWLVGTVAVAVGVILAAIGVVVVRSASDRADTLTATRTEHADIITAISDMRTEVSAEVASIGDALAARHSQIAGQLSRLEGGVGASLEFGRLLAAPVATTAREAD